VDNKSNIYKAIVGYLNYFDELKGSLFRVMALYSLDNEDVTEFDTDVYPGALLEDNDAVEEKGTLPDGVNKTDFYEVMVESTKSKKPLMRFRITSNSKFTPACLLYNAKWIRKKDNLFVSTKGIVQECKSLGCFFPVDKEESLIYSKVILGDKNSFLAEDGVIRKYKLDNLDFLNSAGEVRKNIYVMSQAAFDSIEKSLIEEIDFIDEEELKEWFIKSTEADKEEISAAINKINNEGLDEEAFKIRVDRCRKMFESFAFSNDEISWFLSRKNFKKELEEYRSKKKHQIDADLAGEKQKKQKELETFFDQELEKKLAGTKQELSEKEDLLRKRETELKNSQTALETVKKDLEEQKAGLKAVSDEIATMKTTKEMIVEALREEVKNQSSTSSKKEVSNDVHINDTVFFERGAGVPEVDDDNYRALFPSDFDRSQRSALADILSYRASIVPDVSYAYALAHFMSNTFIKVITVEHGWYHYKDFARAGVLDFYNEALADKENNYLLVLENINIVPIDCAFKPLVDLINGTRLNLPGAGKMAFPKNLRILATVLPSASDEAFGIKLDADSYSGFHFVETPKSRLSISLERIMNMTPRYYVNLASVETAETDGDNGYCNYKDY